MGTGTLVFSGLVFVAALRGTATTSDYQRARCVAPLFQIVWMALSTAWVIGDRLSGNGLDESVMFGLMYGLAGAGFSDFIVVVFVPIGVAVGSALLLNLIFFFRHRPSEESVRTVRPASLPPAILRLPWPRILRVLAILSTPFVVDLLTLAFSYGREPSFKNTAFTCYEAAPRRTADAPPRPPNIVLVYAESLERTFLDADVFPELMPSLAALEKEGLSYTHMDSSYGATWSIGAKVASQCGSPLLVPSNFVALRHVFPRELEEMTDGYERFVPGLACLGDLLAPHGYQYEMFMGHDSQFAGEGKFAREHGARFVGDSITLQPFFPADLPRNNWGIFDDTLLNITARRIHELQSSQRAADASRLTTTTTTRTTTTPSKQPEQGPSTTTATDAATNHASPSGVFPVASADPFLIIVETMDMHHPVGNLSPSCATLGRSSFVVPTHHRKHHNYGHEDKSLQGHFLSATHCFDRILVDFIRRIQDEHTLVVVLSDHPAMPNAVTHVLTKHERRNTFLLLGGPGLHGPAREDSTPSTTLDVAPTVLEAAGFDAASLGLGRSLLRTAKPNLREEFADLHDLNGELRHWGRQAEIIDAIWSSPPGTRATDSLVSPDRSQRICAFARKGHSP